MVTMYLQYSWHTEAFQVGCPDLEYRITGLGHQNFRMVKVRWPGYWNGGEVSARLEGF
jgi:hypothetical protein